MNLIPKKTYITNKIGGGGTGLWYQKGSTPQPSWKMFYDIKFPFINKTFGYIKQSAFVSTLQGFHQCFSRSPHSYTFASYLYTGSTHLSDIIWLSWFKWMRHKRNCGISIEWLKLSDSIVQNSSDKSYIPFCLTISRWVLCHHFRYKIYDVCSLTPLYSQFYFIFFYRPTCLRWAFLA